MKRYAGLLAACLLALSCGYGLRGIAYKAILKAEVEYLQRLGVEIRTSFVVGKTATIEDLKAKGKVSPREEGRIREVR